MFAYLTDTLKVTVFTEKGEVLWRRDLGRSVVPGGAFCPFYVFDLAGDGVDEPGARGSHVCPIVDINDDGIDEFMRGERCIELGSRGCRDRPVPRHVLDSGRRRRSEKRDGRRE